MPELPEVEIIRRQLRPHLRGARIVDAWAFGSAKFDEAVGAVGATITDVGRRGKYLLIGLDRPGAARPSGGARPSGATRPSGAARPSGATRPSPSPLDDSCPSDHDAELVVHLGMTGRLSVTGSSAVPPEPLRTPGRAGVSAHWPTAASRPSDTDRHLRARWWLEDGRELRFDDVRRFGRVAVVPTGEYARLPTLAALGPEPFDPSFDPEHLRRGVNRSRRAIKTQLLGQRIVAGVGNIYADEALWAAGVHPASRRLTVAASGELHAALRLVLMRGIENGGTTLRDYRDASGGEGLNQHHLNCYGRAGAPCQRCGSILDRTLIDARSTTFCPGCQRRTR